MLSPSQPAPRRQQWRYWKGDGTGNDFVVVLDLDDDFSCDAREIAALCNRLSGIGADGLLRVARHTAIAGENDASFFMDYHNADGSLAEMCGNGIRVFTRFLIEQGLISYGVHQIATRAGVLTVSAEPETDISVDMGTAEVLSEELSVVVADGAVSKAVAVRMPNPHAVAVTDDLLIDLSTSPRHHPEHVLADGANYEFVTLLAPGHIAMRVYERGVGQTQSCGTGACAAAVVAAARWGLGDSWTMHVDVPGGQLRVHRDLHEHLHLQGPAQITESGLFAFAADGNLQISDVVVHAQPNPQPTPVDEQVDAATSAVPTSRVQTESTQ